jgi:CPA2 family monovalent cation:H+ antiporter-2
MPYRAPLFLTIVVALLPAFVLGATASRFRISRLVGSLLARAPIGPFTPCYVADKGIAKDPAEIGDLRANTD